MKISKKFTPYLLAVSMGIVMSFMITYINVGFTIDFFSRWLKAFALGASIGIPTSLFVSPFVSKMIEKITV